MNDEPSIWIPVSPGELFDKIAILRLKTDRLGDAAQRQNAAIELALLEKVCNEQAPTAPGLDDLTGQLQEINAELWDIENSIRACEREQEFGPRFVQLARSVYQGNARRAAVKRAINLLLNSPIVEEKFYDDRTQDREHR